MARLLVGGPPLIFLLIFFVVPSLIMILTSFRFPGEFGGLAPIAAPAGSAEGEYGFTPEAYQFFFSDLLYGEIFFKSFAMAAATTLICLIMAYPLAVLIARSEKRFRNLMVLLVVLPFASNFLIRIYAWMIILGPESALSHFINAILGVFGIGPVTLLFSPFAVLVGMVYVHLPFMVLPLYTNLEKHDPSLLDAAQDLGANGWQRFWRITWPLIPARRVFRLRVSIHSCAWHVRRSRYTGRHRRYSHRQSDKGSIPRYPRLAFWLSAFNHADAGGAIRRRAGDMARTIRYRAAGIA